ncbi:cupredoxin domain-containing protein [candidate division WWE3 bacterium]|nr:cupredoxin domain-containing protein [candidate division WWE3 bacterium]
MIKKSPFLFATIFVLIIFGIVFLVNIKNNEKKLTNSSSTDASFNTSQKEFKPDPTLDLNTLPVVDGVDVVDIEKTDDSSSNVKEFIIEAGSFYYKPNSIKVSKGDTVKITLNAVSMMHDLNIEGYGVKTDIVKSGFSTSVTFVAEKAGNFEIYCSVGQHRANGQVGRLVVE